MVTSLPSRIINYKVTAASPTDELLTLGQILAEVGDYASTILDREHLAMARKCVSKLKKVVAELISRRCISSEDNLYEMPETEPEATDLSLLTIPELYALYRRWPIRHKQREAEGREPNTFYYEGRIVRELNSRTPANKAEQFKIDYCNATYQNQLDNLSLTLSLPLHADNEKIPEAGNDSSGTDYTEAERDYTAVELTELIRRHANYRDITERELLMEYIDLAHTLLSHKKDRSEQKNGNPTAPNFLPKSPIFNTTK